MDFLYEVILKIKTSPSSSYERIGRNLVSEEYLKAQIDDYEKKAVKMGVYDYIVLVNKLAANGAFIEVVQ